MNKLERRCIELSYKHKLTHISSVLNAVNLLADIYSRRKLGDPVVLGPSHAALALYVVLEAFGETADAEALVYKHGTHASRDMANGIWVSGGSLGQAETVAVGMAIADKKRTVWMVTSDGSLAEGSVWEALHLAAKLKLTNLNVTVIANGLAGYGEVNVETLKLRILSLLYPVFDFVEPRMEWPWLKGLAGHYMQLNQEQYEEMMAA